MGIERFQFHVDKLAYGNRDLRGTPDNRDGLLDAWLSTSLKITPTQQSDFLQKLVSHELPYTSDAIDLATATTQTFSTTTGHILKGKTGNAWATDAQANRLKEQHGWFVGWLTHRDAQYVFVHLIIETGDTTGFASSRARKHVLSHLPTWLQAR